MAGNKIDLLLNILKKGSGAQQAQQDLSGVQKAVKAAGAAIGGYLTVQTVQQAHAFAKLGGETLRTRNAFVAISGGADEAASRLEAMREATRGALSEQQAMSAANRLMQMGLAENADELGHVTEMAVRLGTAMGRDAAQSIEEFSLLLANQSIPRLDTFGISAGKVRTRIKELQAATPGMTREMAFMQATFEEGAVAMDRLGDSTEDQLLRLEQMEAQLADTKAELATKFVPVWAAFLDRMNMGIEEAINWTDRLRQMGGAFVGLGYHIAGADEAGLRFLERMDLIADASERADSVREAGVAFREMEADTRAAQDALVGMGGAVGQAFREAESASIAATGGIENAGTAAGGAAPLFGGLAQSVTDLGGAFAQGIPDTQDMWNLVLQTGRAAGMSAQEMGAMAVGMGVAERSEVDATLAAYRVIEAWDQKQVSGKALVEVTQLMQKHSEELEKAEAALADGDEELAEAHEEAAEQALEMAEALVEAAENAEETDESVGRMERTTRDAERAMQGLEGSARNTDGALDGVERSARDTQMALEGIEREIYIDIYYREHDRPTDVPGSDDDTPTGPGIQTGTHFWGGGWAMVGEGGPELVNLPRGAAVTPAWRTAMVRNDQRRYNSSYTRNQTVVVQDVAAMAMMLEEARRERRRRVRGGF